MDDVKIKSQKISFIEKAVTKQSIEEFEKACISDLRVGTVINFCKRSTLFTIEDFIKDGYITREELEKYYIYIVKVLAKEGWNYCKYKNSKLQHDGSWIDGKWYEWLDKYGNKEIARMKLDAIDHFYPNANTIKEEDVIAYRIKEEG